MGHEIRDLQRIVQTSQRAADQVELWRIHMLAKKDGRSHEQIARLRNCSQTVLDLIEKGAVSPIGTTDPGMLGLLTNLSDAFVGSVGLFGAFDQIANLGGFRSVPIRTRVRVVCA